MESNNFPNFQKCGEILIDINSKDKKNKIYIFHCTFCNIECDQLKKFSIHIGEEHLNDMENIFNEVELKVEAEPEELQLETFTIIEKSDQAYENLTGSRTVGDASLFNEIPKCTVKEEFIDNYEDEIITCDKESMNCPASVSSNRTEEELGFAMASASTIHMFGSDSYDELRYDVDQRPHKKRKTSFDSKNKLLEQKASTNNVSSDEAKNGGSNLLTINMPKGSDPQQPSKAKWKYLKADKCEELSIKLQSVQDIMERQNSAIVEILAEHKVLLLELLSQKKVVEDIMQVFPIRSEEKLSELNILIQSQPDLYLRRMTSLLKGKVGRYLNEILGHNIIHNFNVDGTHGKQSLKKFESFYSSLINAIAVFSDDPDTALRKAFQLQKKRIFKAKRLLNLKKKENENTDIENIDNDAFI